MAWGGVACMPQPGPGVMPCLAKARIRASGPAAPPTSERMPAGIFQRPGCALCAASKVWIRLIQMVGTPKLSVGGSIATDRTLRTSDPEIFAAGDCADSFHVVTGAKTWIPLALRANRTGWAVADNVCGGRVARTGWAGHAGSTQGKSGEIGRGDAHTSSTSMATSRETAWWVRAPMLMRSTPVEAMAGRGERGTPPLASSSSGGFLSLIHI